MSITSPVGRSRRKRIRPPERIDVACSECGSDFVLSRRTVRERIAEGKPLLCSLCRTFTVAPNQNAPSAERRIRCCSRRDYGWWLRRFSLSELDQLLGTIFGPAALTPAARQRRESIAASAAPRTEKRAA